MRAQVLRIMLLLLISFLASPPGKKSREPGTIAAEKEPSGNISNGGITEHVRARGALRRVLPLSG